MNRSVLGWIAAVIIAVGGGAFAWLWFAGGSGEPSTELTTPTIAGSDTTVAEPETTGAEQGSETTTTETTEPQVGDVAFIIDSNRSTASFEIDEELRGNPQRVVGTTDQVAGQVSLDPSDLSTIEFSQIIVNARTFETDSSQRDRAIRGPVILNSASDEFEFVTFDVTSVDGLEGQVEPGTSLDFTITGDLTVKGTTNPVTFDVVATFTDGSTIEGTATATVLRSDFDIGIPSVPGVANVSDEVVLNLDFVAASG
jgi:polyisoprenoid-binding protein YceI